MTGTDRDNENDLRYAHILVVDDDKAIRGLLHQKITRSGYECFTAHDGQEALKLLEERDIDVCSCVYVPR